MWIPIHFSDLKTLTIPSSMNYAKTIIKHVSNFRLAKPVLVVIISLRMDKESNPLSKLQQKVNKSRGITQIIVIFSNYY